MRRPRGTRAGLEPIGLHEARHCFASFLIASGVNAKAIAVYIGHSSITVTFDRYGHLVRANEAEAAGLLEAFLARADTASRVANLDLVKTWSTELPSEADSSGLERILDLDEIPLEPAEKAQPSESGRRESNSRQRLGRPMLCH